MPGDPMLNGLDTPPTGAPSPPNSGKRDAPLPSPAELLLQNLEGDRDGERRRFRRALLITLLIHLIALIITLPTFDQKIYEIGPPGKVFVMKQMRFKKPPARAQQKQIPKRKARKIPIPDPTPDEPEPIEIAEVELPEVEDIQLDVSVLGIPDAPNLGPSTEDGHYEGAIELGGGGVSKPVFTYQPQPLFTEEARKARIQGIVLLRFVVDAEGNVVNPIVIKDLPLGLTESALETVKTWKAEPATKEGKPVAVYMIQQINFWLQ